MGGAGESAAAPTDPERRGEAVHRQAPEGPSRRYPLRAAHRNGGGIAAAEHIEWRERGAEIWTASLLSFEGDNTAADRLALGAIARLPTEIQTAVLGGPRR